MLKKSLALFILLIAVSSLGQIIYLLFFISPAPSQAQNCNDPSANARFSNGLLTTPATPGPGNRFGGNVAGNPGPCVINQDATQLATFQIPTYQDLKRDYFERISIRYLTSYHINKETNPRSACLGGIPATESNLRFNGHEQLINFTSTSGCDLNLGGNPSGNRSGVVFIDGNLNITADSEYPTSPPQPPNSPPDQKAGVIYIASGNVCIDPSVQIIDGIIMAGGTIYTSCIAGHPITDNTAATRKLVIYGNLINLGNTPIGFQRNLVNVNGNATPAEQIIADPKYLVLFHQLFAQTFSVQTEDTNFAIR